MAGDGELDFTGGPAIGTALTLVATIVRGLPPGEGAALLGNAARRGALGNVALTARAAGEARRELLAALPSGARDGASGGPAQVLLLPFVRLLAKDLGAAADLRTVCFTSASPDASAGPAAVARAAEGVAAQQHGAAAPAAAHSAAGAAAPCTVGAAQGVAPPAAAGAAYTGQPRARARSCAACGAASARGGSRLPKCGGCGLVRYCSPACAKADWPAHKAACRAAQAAAAAPKQAA